MSLDVTRVETSSAVWALLLINFGLCAAAFFGKFYSFSGGIGIQVEFDVDLWSSQWGVLTKYLWILVPHLEDYLLAVRIAISCSLVFSFFTFLFHVLRYYRVTFVSSLLGLAGAVTTVSVWAANLPMNSSGVVHSFGTSIGYKTQYGWGFYAESVVCFTSLLVAIYSWHVMRDKNTRVPVATVVWFSEQSANIEVAETVV